MGTVVGAWRLKLILFLFIFLFILYTINGLFYSIDTDDAGFYVDEESLAEDDGGDFISMLFGFGDYFTFGNIDNTYARIFINIVTTSCWITIGYIIYTFIREWFPLG
jgi:hypothetical protein